MPPIQKFYPALSDLIDASALPGDLQAIENFAQDGIDFLLKRIRYKDLVVDVYSSGDIKYYSLTLLTKSLKLPLFGSGMNLVFFRGSDANFAEFPIIFEWKWPISKYIKRFETQGFSYAPEAFIDILLEMANIESREDFFNQIINVFLDNGTDTYLNLADKIILKVANYSNGAPEVTAEISNITNQLTIIKNKVQETLEVTNLYTIKDVFDNYKDDTVLNDAVDSIDLSMETLRNEYFIDIDIFKDVIEALIGDFSNIDQKFENLLKLFKQWLNEITLQDLKDLLIPQFSLELTNINLALEFPRNWLIPMIEQPVGSGTYIEDPNPDNLSALEFIVGSLKYSTQKGFEFDNQSSFNFQRSLIGKTGIMVELFNLKVDMSKTYNITEATVDGRPDDFVGVYAEKASVTLPEKWFKNENNPNTTLELSGNNLLIGTGGISGTLALKAIVSGNPVTETDYLWLKIGSGGFLAGFNKFDITFKQNKVVSSNIKAALEIKKFVYPDGATYPDGSPIPANTTVRIGIDGHLSDNGDFNLTASAEPPYPIELPDVFTYHLKTVELGKQDDDFYIGTSGSIEFQGFLKDTLNLGPIEIERLRIYSDGSIELIGGSINLIKPIVLSLGPVEITVSAIHYGSHQKEVNGVMRKFNYFGFDGGISVDPLGVEIRGDGVKFYYCSDDLPNKPSSYLHIQTLYLDLTIPSKTPVAIINGWLSIPEPGVSKEYAGGIKLQLPKAKISGRADMKLMPKYPAFIIDAEIEFPAPIPLGTFAIYGFRGLMGYRYVAEKEAIGLVSGVNTWYDYYKAPPRGIHVKKFNGPDKTKKSGTPISIGAGASLGTSFDNGTVLNIKAMVLLSIPSLFMIDGRAAIISARLGLEDTKDPPFFAFVALGDNSLEFGFGADFKMPTKTGKILTLYAEVQAGFFFNSSSKWYVNVGTKTNPITARILTLITLKSYVMLSAKGIEAGARGDFDFKRNYGIIRVHAWAYIEVGGKVSFGRPQFGAYLQAGVGADIDIKFLSFYLAVDILFGVEAPKPFLIYGKFYYKVRIRILWVFKFSFSGDLEVYWEFDKQVDRDPINPFINAENTIPIDGLVKGVNMLSNETFELAYLQGAIPTGLPQEVKDKIIPLDTYIDIKTEKALLPGSAISAKIGGYNNPASNYVDLIPPDKIVKGKELRQVAHQYSIEKIEVKSWNGTQWVDYNPYKALYPDDPSDPGYNAILNNMKIGQFQKTDGQYNTVRLLATTPFSFTEQGQPGWHIPEQYGVTGTTLFCEGQEIEMRYADFLNKPLGQKYYCYTPNDMFYSNQVAFLLTNRLDQDYTFITNQNNSFGLAQSLAINNHNSLQIMLPQPSVKIELSLTCMTQGVRIKFYAPLINDNLNYVTYGNPDPNAANPNEPYTVELLSSELAVAYLYEQNNWNAVTKISIEPLYPNLISQQIANLTEQIAIINQSNNEILLGIAEGEFQSTEVLESELHNLSCGDGVIKTMLYRFDSQDNVFAVRINNQSHDWTMSWDFDTNHKVQENEFGFSRDGKLIIESNYQIMEVKLHPIVSDGSIIPIVGYDVQYLGKKAFVYIEGFEDYIDQTDFFDIEISYKLSGSSSASFVNRYSKPEAFNYYAAEEFVENNSSFIFSIGKTEGKGLLSKIETNGDLIWEKTYNIAGNKEPLTFKSIIQLDLEKADEKEKERGYQYIVYASSANNYYLLSINSQGNVLWNKHIGWEDRDVLFHIEASKTEYCFYVAISDRNEIDVNKYPYIGKSDSSGNFIIEKIVALPGEEFIINTIYADENGIVLAGRYIEKDSRSFIIRLNSDLKNLDLLHIVEPYTTIHNVRTIDKQYLISGYDNSSDSLFVSIIKGYGGNLIYHLPKTKNQGSSIELNDNGFYLLQYTETHGILHQLDFDFNILWTKEIRLEKKLNGIRNFTFNKNTQKITLNAFNQSEGSLVVHTDKDFQSCLTYKLDKQEVSKGECNVKELGIEEKEHKIRTKDLDVLTNLISSQKIAFCPDSGSECGDEDEVICNLRSNILSIYENCFEDPKIVAETGKFDQTGCAREILNLIKIFSSNYPDYNLPENLDSQLHSLNVFMEVQNIETYTAAWNAVQFMISYLDKLGNCTCECGDDSKKITMLHKIGWLSREDYVYNVNIPSQEAITEDTELAIAGINKFIQPIWRPDTNYVVYFELKDTVDYGTSAPGNYKYAYGFTTAGPVGYFHTDEKATYGDIPLKAGDVLTTVDGHTFTASNGQILEDANGIIRNADGSENPAKITPHPDKYALTSLKQYIDYNRSYPNADGNLLSAKPLFYNDDTTQIYLFFNKVYATHFFHKWENYNNKPAADGRLKIVIKDPREDVSITNPPYLDYDESDVEHINIPQTVEQWNLDNNPQIPFVISQYANLFGNGGCTGIIETIKPASQYIKITPKHLKPNKLYTAIVNNMYDVNHNGVIENTLNETREVHKFVFKTSRYATFKEQVESYYLEQDIEGELMQKEALFKIEKTFTVEDINAAYNTIIGQPVTGLPANVISNLNNNYQHPFDRVLEGILGFSPLDEAISTEINVIRNSEDNKIIAVMVRNPEPFNNPKFPLSVMQDTIQILNGSVPNNAYKVLFSKDNSQAIIMNTSKEITENFNLRFKYKIYQDDADTNPDNNYVVSGDVTLLNVAVLNN